MEDAPLKVSGGKQNYKLKMHDGKFVKNVFNNNKGYPGITYTKFNATYLEFVELIPSTDDGAQTKFQQKIS